MSSKIIQENRLISVETPFGADALQLTEVIGKEVIGRSFLYQLTMLSEDENLDPNKIVGKKINFSLELLNGEKSHYSGYVCHFRAASPQPVGTKKGALREYYADVVPWFWFLGKTTDCRIFQNKSIPEIISQVLADHDNANYSLSKLVKSYPKHEYCVQYRETDAAFVNRLMHEAGISFYFEQSQDDHTLMLSDDKTSYQPCTEAAVEFNSHSRANDHIFQWEKATQFSSGKYSQRAYNFKTPSTDLTTSANGLSDISETKKYEIFDYPGEYYEKSDGTPETSVRMEEAEARENTISASSHCRSFFAGGTFKLKKYDVKAEEKKEYLITELNFHVSDKTQTNLSYADQDYSNNFSCIPKSVPFRSSHATYKPEIRGIQTAIVTGSAGDEVYIDEYGRIKVQFHWDREGKRNENSSCWIRVSQTWAGNGWGAVFHPRIGQEVIVSFIEGDPDRPLITGRVYNGEQVLPYDCPQNKTQSGIKTRSTTGGNPSTFNELRFEDKIGSEQVYIHAEKDLDTVVEHDETLSIGNNRTKVVGVDEKNDIGSNRDTNIGNNDTLSVGNNISIDAGSSITLKTGAAEIKMSADGTIKIKGVSVTVEGVTVNIKGGASVAIKAPSVSIN